MSGVHLHHVRRLPFCLEQRNLNDAIDLRPILMAFSNVPVSQSCLKLSNSCRIIYCRSSRRGSPEGNLVGGIGDTESGPLLNGTVNRNSN